MDWKDALAGLQVPQVESNEEEQTKEVKTVQKSALNISFQRRNGKLLSLSGLKALLV